VLLTFGKDLGPEGWKMEAEKVKRFLQGLEREHSVLSLARDPSLHPTILFLDEFQMPDRASSKLFE
jgi:hypothetical protein